MSLLPAYPPAILALANGSVFGGYAIGASGSSSGEVVFNTAMTGYQEILTDPSYSHQIVTLTYPHIGNTGCNEEDFESRANFAAGLVVRDCPSYASNWRMKQGLDDYLKQHNIIAIAGVDTRALTSLLREQGAQSGCVFAAKPGATIKAEDEQYALGCARSAPSLSGMDLASQVSIDKPYHWESGEWSLTGKEYKADSARFHVVAYDFGVKRNILRMLVSRGCRVTVVPAKTPVEQVLALEPDGVFLSNGPGDPAPCDYAISSISALIARRIPLFGICLGHQLLALACGAKTLKMKFGHHGANHPVQDVEHGRVLISSQNHGFAVDAESLPEQLKITHISLFDGSVQGIAHTSAPAFSFQGHPEASPGPHDVALLFDQFIELMAVHAIGSEKQ